MSIHNANTPAPAQHDPIYDAIFILTEEADSLCECHTRTPGDWAGEPEAKARYDHILSVVAALSKLRAPVACDCPGGNKPADLHAPNCPVRQAQAKLLDPYDGGTWVASAPVADESVNAHNAAIKAAAKVCADIARQYDPQNNQENALAGELYSAAAAILKLVKEGHAALASAPVAGEAQRAMPSAKELMALHRECEAMRGGRGMLYLNYAHALLSRYAAPQASEAVRRAEYAGVTVWVGDRQATQIVTQKGLELSNKDELLERFEIARAALSAQQGAQKLPENLPENLRRPLDYIDPTGVQKNGGSDA